MSPQHAKRKEKRARRVSPSRSPLSSAASENADRKLSRQTLHERQLAQDLKENAAKYRAMVESFDGMVYICSKDYKVEFANKQLKKRAGCDPVGKSCYRVLHARNSVCPWCQNKQVFQGKTLRWDLQSPKDGRWYHVINTPLRHADGSLSKLATITDITDRKKAETTLLTEKEKFKAIFNQTYQLIGLMSKDGILLEANRTALDYAGVKAGAVLKKPFWKTPWWRHSKEVRARLRKAIRSAARGKFVRYETSHSAKDGSIRFVDFSIRPVRDERGKVAFLIPEGWDITERKLVERSLLESEGMFRTLTERSPNMIFINQGGRVVYANPKCEEVMGYTIKEFYAPRFDFLTLMHPDDVPKVRRNFLAHQRGEEIPPYEYRMITQGGGVIQVILTTKIIQYREKPAILGMVTDISGRKRAEEALRKSEEKYKQLIETTGTGYVILDDRGRVVDANSEYVRLTGHRRLAEILGRSVLEWTASYDYDRNAREVRKCFKQGYIRNLEVDYLTPAGQVNPIEGNATVYRDAGRIRILAMCRDITDRKKAEALLTQREAHLSALIENQPGMVWLKDAESRFLAVNQKFADAAGVKKPKNVIGKTDFALWPEDLAKKYRTDDKRTMKTRKAMMEEEPIVDRGVRKWFETFKTPVVNDAGGVIGTAGYAQDITERKRTDAALRESEEKFRAMFETSPSGMALCEMDGRLVQVNQAYLDIIGYTHKEALKLTYWDLTPKEYAAGEAKQLRLMKKTGRYGPYEKEYIHKTGRRVPVLLNGAVVTGADGKNRIWSVVFDITERKQVEEALRETQLFLQETQTIARLAGWKANPLTDYLEWTDGVFEIIGLPKGRQPGLAEGLKFYLPEYIPKLRDSISRCLAIGERFSLQCQGITGTGKKIWTEVRGLAPVVDGERVFVMGTFQDITERKQAEEAIRESQRELREIIDTVPHLICAKDVTGRFLMANRAMAELYGMRPEELVGKRQKDFHPVKKEAESILAEDREVIRTGKPKAFSPRVFTDVAKREHFLQTFKIPFKLAGSEEPSALVVAVDVTEQKKVEDFRNEIVRTLSHELRTPLSIEKGGISLLLDGSAGGITDEQKLLLETVMRNIDRLSRMIDKLLDVSRIESGKWKMVFKDVDLREVVRETVMEFEHMERKAEVALTAVYGDEEAKARADKDGIAQVLTNLIGNALKFTPQGNVEVSVRVLREEIECSVRDTGVGITPENMAKMFEKFQQFSWPAGAGKEGVGLGLAIAKGIIEMHRGRIWARSVPGEGTTVTFVLPRSYGKGAEK